MKRTIFCIIIALVLATAALAVLTLGTSAVRDEQGPNPASTPRKKRSGNATTMSNANKDPKSGQAEAGMWGGNGVSLNLEASGGQVAFECAEGEIAGPLIPYADGNFKVRGTFTQRRPGPRREDQLPAKVKVTYEGSINGNVMTLKLTAETDGSELGNYSLERDRFVRLHRCY